MTSPFGVSGGCHTTIKLNAVTTETEGGEIPSGTSCSVEFVATLLVIEPMLLVARTENWYSVAGCKPNNKLNYNYG